jgi:uncharacterized protein with LGFP repeats
VLGFPTADLVSVAGGTGARFQGGSIYSSPGTGAHTVRGVDADWLARGGPAGALGFPTVDTVDVKGGGGYAGLVTEFTGGTLYSSSVTPAAVLSGDVLAHYNATGGPAASGFPLADQGPVPGGQAVGLQYASIYSSPGTGPHLVWGGSRASWWARGGLGSALGFPASDTTAVTGGGGVAGLVTEFTGGTLYTSTATPAAVLSGNVLAHYKATGGPAASGFPLADQAPVPGGEAVGLQYATIYSSPGTGPHLVWGETRRAWWAGGELTGPLGFPTSDTTVVTANGEIGTVTAFERGTIYASASTGGGRVVKSPVDIQYRAAGGPASSYGWPTSNTYAVPGGVRNDFQSGQITG